MRGRGKLNFIVAKISKQFMGDCVEMYINAFSKVVNVSIERLKVKNSV